MHARQPRASRRVEPPWWNSGRPAGAWLAFGLLPRTAEGAPERGSDWGTGYGNDFGTDCIAD